MTAFCCMTPHWQANPPVELIARCFSEKMIPPPPPPPPSSPLFPLGLHAHCPIPMFCMPSLPVELLIPGLVTTSVRSAIFLPFLTFLLVFYLAAGRP